MVFGFPGFFILSGCPNGCPSSYACLVCQRVGKPVCIVHSEAPYIVPFNSGGMLALHRGDLHPPISIRTVCGDAIIFLESRYRNWQ
jgi:hypothetical protein